MDKAVGGLQGLGIAALRLVLGWTPIEAGNGRAVGGGRGGGTVEVERRVVRVSGRSYKRTARWLKFWENRTVGGENDMQNVH